MLFRNAGACVPAGALPTSIAAQFASPEYAWLVENLGYLTPGLRAVADIYNAEAEGVILDYITFLVTFSSCWLAFFTLTILLFFSPSVNAKNNDIHTTRSMLLYLPVQVVARVKSILALVEDILAKNSDATTGIPSSSSRQVVPM